MTNKVAAALQYDDTKPGAPKLIAKGQQDVAARIIEIAKQNNIPIQEDADLVMILNKLELEQEIPLELYSIVAEIFALIYNINKSK